MASGRCPLVTLTQTGTFTAARKGQTRDILLVTGHSAMDLSLHKHKVVPAASLISGLGTEFFVDELTRRDPMAKHFVVNSLWRIQLHGALGCLAHRRADHHRLGRSRYGRERHRRAAALMMGCS